ncbi:hypothetical protein O9G_000683 [Rozella allomycis CSF55]|uniref:Uncharacterized protein n=1 Tax=Rozella allomycis (strain CSF55) TaxID=988480 RepID=A0A075AYD1_ROZAC|nr:hypothetical protein O9G_000683 [Rozella allomycis CSF55]|eukprot:EPZ35287.1 hypothetical protein O9G_000683 [Rozella allomycis CSF55]
MNKPDWLKEWESKPLSMAISKHTIVNTNNQTAGGQNENKVYIETSLDYRPLQPPGGFQQADIFSTGTEINQSKQGSKNDSDKKMAYYKDLGNLISFHPKLRKASRRKKE